MEFYLENKQNKMADVSNHCFKYKNAFCFPVEDDLSMVIKEVYSVNTKQKDKYPLL